MKKILILLLFFYSFAFSLATTDYDEMRTYYNNLHTQGNTYVFLPESVDTSKFNSYNYNVSYPTFGFINGQCPSGVWTDSYNRIYYNNPFYTKTTHYCEARYGYAVYPAVYTCNPGEKLDVLNKICTTCNDQVPDGYIEYPAGSNGGCASYDSLSDEQKALYINPFELPVTVCSTCYAKKAACNPLSTVSMPISQAQCTGTHTVHSDTIATQGSLQWQQCDNSCYVLEPTNVPCPVLIPQLQQTCDTDLNNFKTTCNDTNPDFTQFTYECTPDNNNTNPCQDAYESLSSTCNGTIEGSCHDNGMIITSNTMQCIPPNPDDGSPCETAYNAKVTECSASNQSVMGSCQSKDGAITSNDLRCSPLPPDNNGTPNIDLTDTNNILRDIRSEISVSNTALDGIKSNTNNINNKLSTSNNELSKIKNNTNLINNNLNNVNNNLNSIKKLSSDSKSDLDTIKNDIEGFKNATYDDPNTANESKITAFLNDAKSGIDDIENDFNNLNDLISNGFTVPIFSSGVAPTFTTTVFNKPFILDLCPAFSVFRPILFYIFLLIFTYLSLVIFYKGFKILSS